LAANLRGLLSIPTLWRAQLPFVVLYAVIAGAGCVAVLRRRVALPVLCTCVVPLAVCVAGFVLVHPIFGYITGTFVWLVLPYALLLAAGIQSLPSRLGVVAVVLLLLGNAEGLRNVYAEASPPLDAVAGTIAARLRPGDGLVLSRLAATRWGLAYYFGPSYGGRIRGLDVDTMPAEGWPISEPTQLRGLNRVWLVLPDGEAPALAPDALVPPFELAWQARFASVLVQRYDRPAE
jgi:hypothetical protein